MNKCFKVTIKECKEFNKKELNQILLDLRYKTYQVCNRIASMSFVYDMENIEHKKITGEYYNTKDLFGKTMRGYLYDVAANMMEEYNTNNVSQIEQFALNQYSKNKKDGLLKGNVSLNNYKKDMPIIIHNASYEFKKESNTYICEIGLFSTKYKTEHNLKGRLHFVIDKTGNYQNAILDRLISGEYKKCAGQIVKENGKWMLIVSYDFEPIKRELNYNKVLGVDIGMVNVATMTILDTTTNKYEWLKDCFIPGKELLAYKHKIEAFRRDLYIAGKWAGKGRVGHGRKCRNKPADRVGDKYKRFKDTYNHKISKYIVQTAIENDCGIIQMEDLSGFTDAQKDRLLKDWSYYDLQAKIEYKAEEAGIKVLYILPTYTSKRCNCCGWIDEENRDGKTNQSQFKCTRCGHKANADVNAAKNIAMPDLEDVILEQLQLQAKFNNKYDGYVTYYKKKLAEKKKGKEEETA